eukprot:CAMPEP_0205807696 /NCGR_PEP_ID=MMETSP0205-20121125/11462_1 /ASSEMBLY_ACC=CAM_ASM_000278 /TAXON_ID=36767 /ORGANISM="Euplotes focardii, Strain TN1" /LENGTH=49 /DNA_ID=CAMNT_0053082257 /DNA_START=1929 /DNA_END=2078 /DNA_ORIENTATION=-
MTDLSGVILDLLKRAYETVDMDFDESNVSGVSNPMANVAKMLNEVESFV